VAVRPAAAPPAATLARSPSVTCWSTIAYNSMLSTYVLTIGHVASSTRQRKSQGQYLFDDD